MSNSTHDLLIRVLVESGEAEIKTGPFGTQLKASDYVSDGIPVINVRNVGFGDIRPNKLEFINDHTADRLSSHLLKRNDIVFGRKGAVERHAFIKQEQHGWLQGSDCIRLRIKSDRINPRYLSYCFQVKKHQQWMMAQCSHGATMASLNQDIISRIPVCLPDKDMQDEVVSILESYDNLIENNNRRISILEGIAQSLYREWFVKFRFSGHEQCQMVDSPLGSIPEGWNYCSFTKVADVLSGGTPKTKEPSYWGGDIPFFAPKDAPSNFYCLETEKHITDLGLNKCSSKLYSKNTVFITARGTVGKVVLPAFPMAMNQSCYALKSKSDDKQRYLYLLTKSQVSYLKKNTGGATFDTIIKDTFDRMMVAEPPEDLKNQFEKLVSPLFEQMLNLSKQSSNLKKQRDLLLPKLISGQIEL